MVGKDQENLPETLEVKLSDQKTRQIKLDVQEVEERAVLLTGTASSTFPPQFGGPLMGGDPVWNNMATQWGTITFAAETGRFTPKVMFQCRLIGKKTSDRTLNLDSSLTSTALVIGKRTVTKSLLFPSKTDSNEA